MEFAPERYFLCNLTPNSAGTAALRLFRHCTGVVSHCDRLKLLMIQHSTITVTVDSDILQSIAIDRHIELILENFQMIRKNRRAIFRDS